MKENKLWVAVKRACQTTRSLQGIGPWTNRLETLEVSRQDQVWVADITYIRLNGRFIYLCLLMDVFTRVIRAWEPLSQHLNQSLTLKPLKEALSHSVPEIHHSDQGVQYLSKAYVTTTKLVLTLQKCGLNKRMHFKVMYERILADIENIIVNNIQTDEAYRTEISKEIIEATRN